MKKIDINTLIRSSPRTPLQESLQNEQDGKQCIVAQLAKNAAETPLRGRGR